MPDRRPHRRLGLWLMLIVPWLIGQGCPPPSNPPGGNGSTEQLVFSGLNAALLSISGTSATDVYAVGADPGDGSGPYVLHYDGTAWQRLQTGASGDLWWISVSPIDGDFYMAGTEGKVLQFHPSNGEFSAFDTPGDDIAFGVWGASASAIWAVGGDLDAPDDSGFIWRYNGSDWVVEDLTDVVPEGLPILYKVWGRSANDVYAVGRLGTVLHYDGTAWSQVTTDTTRTLFTVHGNAETVVASGGFGDAVILEQEGNAFVNRAPAGLPQMNGVYIPPDGRGVTGGNEGSIAQRLEGEWTRRETAFDTIRDFHAVWVDPQGGIWAVGGNLSASLNDGILAYIGSATISTDVVD